MRGLLLGIAAVLLVGMVCLDPVEAAAQEGDPPADLYLRDARMDKCTAGVSRPETVAERLCAVRAYSAQGRRDRTLAFHLLEALVLAEEQEHRARPILAIELADLLIELGDRATALQALDRHVGDAVDPVIARRAELYRMAAEMLPYPAPEQLAALEEWLAEEISEGGEQAVELQLAGWRLVGNGYLAIDEKDGARRAFERLFALTETGPIHRQRYRSFAGLQLAQLAFEQGDIEGARQLLDASQATVSEEQSAQVPMPFTDGRFVLNAEMVLAEGVPAAEAFPGELIGDPSAEWRPLADWGLDIDAESQQQRERLLSLYRRIYVARGGTDITRAPGIPDLPQLLSLAFEQAQSLSTSTADDAAEFANNLRQLEDEEERLQLQAYDRIYSRYRQGVWRYAQLGHQSDEQAVASVMQDISDARELMDRQPDLIDYFRLIPGGEGRWNSLHPWYLRARQWFDEGQAEDMLLIVPADGDIHVFVQGWTGDTGFAWHVVEDGEAIIAPLVERLRCQVDYRNCTLEAGAALNAIPLSPLQEAGQFAYDRQAAYELYRLLIQPVEPALTPGADVFVMARGAMSTMPLAMLVTEVPEEGYDWADYSAMRDASWLGDRYAFTTTPSFDSFRPNRMRPLNNVSQEMLFAVADPAFEGEAQPGELRSADLLLMTREGRLANVAAIRTLAALPGTRKEYESMRNALNPPAEVALLGPEATEAALRTHPALPDARFVLLATHGLLPRQNDGAIVEPSLVFTPPEEPTLANDGLLTASEVRDLTLRAEWVFLSACNTAAAGGSGDSLSELASAFLRAGALQVLASHWPVLDEVTPVLTTATIRASAENRRGGPGRALQSAIQSVRTGQTAAGTGIEGWQEGWAHPMAWAPFVLISNGDEAIVNQRFDSGWNSL